LAYIPAGCDVYSESENGGEYLRIVLAGERGNFPAHTKRFSDVIDPISIAAAQELRRLMLGDRIDALQGERLIGIIEQRAICFLSGTVTEPSAGSWMTPARLRLIDEYIDARLATKLTVHELAEALGLSAGFFSRTFRAAIGKAPHDYLIDCRISRARSLLLGTELDLAAVAYASGFVSHAHMTSTFQHRLGIAPSKLRKDTGSERIFQLRVRL
jgi:AraC family transcriptional regulator